MSATRAASRTRTDHPALGSGTHVAYGAFTAERLVRLGAINMVLANDCLILGPNRQDPQEHARVRVAWWESPSSWDQLYSKEVHWELPVMIWVSANPVSRPNLWRTCCWLRHLGISPRDVLVLDFDPAPRGVRAPARFEPFDCTDSVTDHPDDVLLRHLADASPWSKKRFERAAGLWEQYAAPDPRGFVKTSLQGLADFPELAGVGALLSSFFPRQGPEGKLLLSRFDELLLTALSPKWLTPVKVYLHDRAPWRHLTFCTGDGFVPRRLDHWAHHEASAAVERAPGPRSLETHGPMLSSVYRLTKRGIQLRAGLQQLTDAPRLPVAGSEAYAPEAPWVLCDDGRLVRS